MKKPVSRQMHALVADYPYVALVSTAPESVGFTAEETAALLCRALAGGALVYSLCTRAEWGLAPVLSYRAHLALDFAAGVFALAAPWLFGFAGNQRARNTFLAMGAAGILAGGVLSEPSEMEAQNMRDALGPVRVTKEQ